MIFAIVLLTLCAMVYNLHITTDEAGALLELSDSLADQLEGVVEAFNRTIHPAGGY